MSVTSVLSGPLPEAEHRTQLRRAVIASTVGTTIEWYDFLLYSTVTGLVFGKLFFPHSDPLVGVLEAFAIYTVGFIARPIGAAIFGHYGDRIGRKATLIATLLITGLATFAVGLVPTYETVGIWGAVILTVIRFIQGIGVGGEWGGSVLLAMEWARTNKHRGFIASWPQLGGPAGLLLANIAVLAFSTLSGDQFPGLLGLAHSVPAQHRHGRDRALHPARHPRDAGLPAHRGRATRRARARDRGAEAPTPRGHPLSSPCVPVGAGLPRSRLSPWDHQVFHQSRSAGSRATGGGPVSRRRTRRRDRYRPAPAHRCAPVIEVLKRQPREVILSALARTGEQAPAYIYLAFVFAYGTQVLHQSALTSRLSALITASIISLFTIPIAGALSGPLRPQAHLPHRFWR